MVNIWFFVVLLRLIKQKALMDKPFIYGMSVEGEHFTDRELELCKCMRSVWQRS